MAYDLISRTQTPANFARPSSIQPPRGLVIRVLELCIAGAVIALPEIQRQRENSKIKKEFATDFPLPVPGKRKTYAERVLKTTMELPAIPMRDLVFNKSQSA
jgi:hypothetical protein